MKDKNLSTQSFLGTVLRGLLMGGADVIPGVSGGTVALVTGIYPRLVGAISRVDREFAGHIVSMRFRQAAEHIDLRFLGALALGVLTGAIAMLLVVDSLLTSDQTRPITLAAFCGMIFASSLLVAKMVEVKKRSQTILCVVAGIAGLALTGWIATLTPTHVEPSLWFVFVCGVIAICAMILPGVSGAMLLVLLGVYQSLAHLPKEMAKGENLVPGSLTIVVFGAGCAIGLLAFSKVLRRLLESYRAVTLSALCGMMFGSLVKLWPFQKDLTPDLPLKLKHYAPQLPDWFASQTYLVFGVMLLATALILGLDWIARSNAFQLDVQEDARA